MINLKCFIGVIGSGKDYQCKKLVNEEGYTQVNLADELRQMTWEVFNWRPLSLDEYEAFKDNAIIRPPNNGEITGRQILQNLGTALKNRHEAYWAKIWAEKVNKLLAQGKDVCCSDIRYMDEVIEAINLKDGYAHKLDDFVNVEIIFCNYKSDRYCDNNPHMSERLSQILLNNGFEDLEKIDLNYFKSSQLKGVK